MKKYFNKYANQAAYEAANNKWPHVSYIEETDEVKYEENIIDYSTQYFTTVALSDGNIEFKGNYTANTFSYSTDKGQTWSTPAQVSTVAVSNGQKVMWKGTPTIMANAGIGKFTTATTANFSVEGNAMSLLFGDNFQGKTSLAGKGSAFRSLFQGNTTLQSAENLILPATTLVSDCYSYMFRDCTSLTTAPSLLPATTLANECYYEMFNGCTSLTTAPSLLPATTLANGSYRKMFYGCTSLNSITCLATDRRAYNCTQNWVSGVNSTGTFTKAASMTSWPTGNDGIPQGWTVQDYQG